MSSEKQPEGGGVTYEPPRITDHGDLVELTAGAAEGAFTDAAFPVGTPKPDLIFSTP